MAQIKTLCATIFFLFSCNIFALGSEEDIDHNIENSGTCFHEYIPRLGIPKAVKTIQTLRALNIEDQFDGLHDKAISMNEGPKDDLWQKFLIDGPIEQLLNKEASSKKRSFEIGMKILFISVYPDAAQEPAVDLAKIVFQGRGIPYDHFVVRRAEGILRSDLPTLVDQDGNPKYYGVVLSTSELGFSENGIYKSALSTEQWEALVNYERTYNVRRVSLYSYPSSAIGVELVDGNNANAPDITVSQSAFELDKSLIVNSNIPLKNDWHYQAKIIKSDNAKEILTYNNEEKTVAAITKKLDDGREQMHFFFTQGQWVKASVALAQTWLNWMTRGTYLGNRRVYLNVQIDDFFLSSDLWDSTQSVQKEGGKIFRLSVEDFKEFTRWQHFNFRPLSSNAAFRVELAFNGFGTILSKPATGNDPLLTYAQSFYNQYFWLSHTYTHADLNFTTYQETDEELKKNVDFTVKNFFTIPGFNNFYSSSSMVTPRISGLLREDSLKALWNNGIKYVTGDNTRPELRPPHPFTAKYSTKELNGFPGILIVPRNATEIYYNASSPTELLSEYNFRYFNDLKKQSNLEDIYNRESERVANNLLKYDASPYMFHQANMGVFNYRNKKYSLLSLWMERVVEEIRKYNTLPILNLKMDDLKDFYLNKMSYEKCGVNAVIKMYDGEMQKIILKSAKGNCFVPITSPKLRSNSVKGNAMIMQTYGPDTNTFVKIAPESQNIEISL